LIVDVLDHVAGARSARGIAVVIDVFRAFATAAYAYCGGAARVVPVAGVSAALDLRGRTVVHTTHAGTQGLLAATAADEVLTGSFVNISAVHRYLRTTSPERVSLVRMGHEARERCLEDDLYAETLQRLLEGRGARLDGVRETLRDAAAAQKFFDPACDWAPQADFDYCTDVDRFDFVLRLRREPGQPPCLDRITAPRADLG